MDRHNDEIDFLSFKIKKLTTTKEITRPQLPDEDDDRGTDDVRPVLSHRSMRHEPHRQTTCRREEGKTSYHDNNRAGIDQNRYPNKKSIARKIENEYRRLPPFEPNTCVESYLEQSEACARYNEWNLKELRLKFFRIEAVKLG